MIIFLSCFTFYIIKLGSLWNGRKIFEHHHYAILGTMTMSFRLSGWVTGRSFNIMMVSYELHHRHIWPLEMGTNCDEFL